MRALGRLVVAGVCLAATTATAQEAGQPPEQRLEETVTVTATRLPEADLDLSTRTRVVTAGELRLQSALDEALRLEPALSLFRRTPARGAHPTTHGINLRGIAPTGTSRALALVDGAPLTDAFGGWVQWDRLPLSAIRQVEIGYGGGAGASGSQALSGVLQVVTRNPDLDRLALHASAGSRSAWEIGATWGDPGAGVLLSGVASGGNGYQPLPPELRGPIDRPVALRRNALWLKYAPAEDWTLSADAFRADRDNGTPARTNRIEGTGLQVGWHPGADPGTSATGWMRLSGLESVFSSVSEDRTTETPVLSQRVPSLDAGARSALALGRGAGWRATAGLDLRHVSGRSDEQVLLAGFRRSPGGSQQIAGLWSGASGRIGELRLEGSLRADGWRNRAREGGERRSATSLSPRLGLVWQPTGHWSLRAAAYGAFRAPTLNELYRLFRVGDVVTAANPELRPETLWGGEAGLVFRGGRARRAWKVELTGYLAHLDDAVINATVGVEDGLLLRQRRNLGASRTSGIELDARLRSGRLDLGVAAVLIRSRIRSTDAPETIGNRLPQVPPWRLTVSSGWSAPTGWSLRLALQATGRQYEDDRNTLELAPGATLDASGSWPVAEGLALSLRADNLLDRRLEVARTPILSLGPPRTLRVGLEWISR